MPELHHLSAFKVDRCDHHLRAWSTPTIYSNCFWSVTIPLVSFFSSSFFPSHCIFRHTHLGVGYHPEKEKEKKDMCDRTRRGWNPQCVDLKSTCTNHCTTSGRACARAHARKHTSTHTNTHACTHTHTSLTGLQANEKASMLHSQLTLLHERGLEVEHYNLTKPKNTSQAYRQHCTS